MWRRRRRGSLSLFLGQRHAAGCGGHAASGGRDTGWREGWLGGREAGEGEGGANE